MNVNIMSNVGNCDFKIHLYHFKQMTKFGDLYQYILKLGPIKTLTGFYCRSVYIHVDIHYMDRHTNSYREFS